MSVHVRFAAINPHLIGGVGAVSLPIGYVIKKHMDWEKTEQGKKRMLTHHLVFWGSFALGLALVHRTFFAPVSNLVKGFRYLAGGLIGAQGFTTGEWLARYLFPHLPKRSQSIASQNASQNLMGSGRRYVPSYLKDMDFSA